MVLTSKRASAIGRIGAHRQHALHDARATTLAARQASARSLNARLLTEIDPDGTLPPAERRVRLEHARTAHFQQLRLRR